MKHSMLIFTLLLIASDGNAQSDQAEINEQVWKPFVRAIINQDVSSFVSLHSSDLVRAEINQKNVMNLDEYRKRMEADWPGWKASIQKNKSHYDFELRFIERISNGSLAYETGYFKNETVSFSGEKRVGYGKFVVVLRKEGATWKILVDSDSNEGGTITSEMFMAANPIQ